MPRLLNCPNFELKDAPSEKKFPMQKTLGAVVQVLMRSH